MDVLLQLLHQTECRLYNSAQHRFALQFSLPVFIFLMASFVMIFVRIPLIFSEEQIFPANSNIYHLHFFPVHLYDLLPW